MFKKVKNGIEVLVGQAVFKLQIKTVKILVVSLVVWDWMSVSPFSQFKKKANQILYRPKRICQDIYMVFKMTFSERRKSL